MFKVGGITAIVVKKEKEIEEFAASELKKIFSMLGIGKIKIINKKQKNGSSVILSSSQRSLKGFLNRKTAKLPSQGYKVLEKDGNIIVAGGDGAGVLYGAYALLEAIGVRFLAPGDSGIIVPKNPKLNLSQFPLSGKPRFPERGFAERLPEILLPKPTLEECLDFMARLRFNNINIWHSRLVKYSKEMPDFLAQARRRGINVELGGHEFETLLLPRSEFKKHPEWFRATSPGPKGLRSADHNCCASSPAAIKRIEENAAKIARKTPEVDVYHFWPADLDGGWCSCPACKHLTASDQSMICMNAVARGVKKVNPKGWAVFIAYAGTDRISSNITPEENVLCMTAPLGRCFGHGLGDKSCDRNAFYLKAMSGQAKLFKGRPNSVFEYFTCGCCVLRNMNPPLLKLIHQDLPFYKKLGFTAMRTVFSNTRNITQAELLGLIGFARMTYDAKAQPREVRADYAKAVFGANHKKFDRILREWEEVMTQAYRHCEAPDDNINGTTLWPIGKAYGEARETEKNIEKAQKRFDKLRKEVEKFPRKNLSKFGIKRLDEFILLAKLTQKEIGIHYCQVRGQNERMAYFIDGNIKHVRNACELLKEGVAGCRKLKSTSKSIPLTDTDVYRNAQDLVGEDLEFVRKICVKQLKTHSKTN